MIKETIEKLIAGKDLTLNEVTLAMEEIMTAKVTPIQAAAFLTALRVKGESIEEITAAARVMRKFATPIKIDQKTILDTCGTGGDCKGTFNISTISALVVAATGVTVAKHGNRSVSSKCGSADLLEGLGVNINLSPEKVEQCIKQVGMGFLFAPNFHPLMKQVAMVRKELGFRTVFNILGPLSNPTGATHQILGVYDRKLVKPIATVLKNLQVKRAMVVHGGDGLDEITTTTTTDICEVKNGKIKCYTLNPVKLGVKKASLSSLRCRDLSENIEIAQQVLNGKPGAPRDIVMLNAAAAIYLVGKSGNIKAALEIAVQVIDSGQAQEKFNQLREFSKTGE